MRLKTRQDITKNNIIHLLDEHHYILRKYNVLRIGLFGYYVRGEQKKDSDIDFLVEFDLTAFGKDFDGYYDNFMDLVSYLEDLFGRKVDLVTIGNLSPYIQPYVEKEVKWYEG
ncbi:MAG: nucleotidyltransferase family protein [Nitrospirae bacterium]|nr:nucleotidyltransferase family protein [Nitrospirota bacterium]